MREQISPARQREIAEPPAAGEPREIAEPPDTGEQREIAEPPDAVDAGERREIAAPDAGERRTPELRLGAFLLQPHSLARKLRYRARRA